MIKSRSNSANSNIMIGVSAIKASNVSTIYVTRGKRAGIFEIVRNNSKLNVEFAVMQNY